MPFQIVRNDITKMQCDAIVNAAKESLLGGGGVDGAIHAAAGPRLLEKCRTLGGCKPGQAKITRGYDLPAKFVIHTVGPVWRGGGMGEKETLAACYRNSLELARRHFCASIAFPLISSGAYGYPKDQALQVAMDTIREFLAHTEMQVYLVVFDRESFQASKSRIDEITEYIDEIYAGRFSRRERPELREKSCTFESDTASLPPLPENLPAPPSPPSPPRHAPARKSAFPSFPPSVPRLSLTEMLNRVDESFSQMLLRKITEKGMTDAQCYKKANIDRKLFSKIRKDVHYKPSKTTAIAFAISLELSLEETRDLLEKAGFALSHSSKFDIIIEYFISRRIYDIFEINETLFAFDQSLLGG